jgi:hypothetical protein
VWSLDTEAFVVGAADAKGETLFDRSSRFASPPPSRPHLLLAEGIDTLGPRAGCRPKTEAERKEDLKGKLSARVGAGTEACWEIKSGTSFSAGMVTKMLCLIHQSLSALRSVSDPATVAGAPTGLPTFVRAYVDFDFDRELKVFENRLADSRVHFGPLAIAYPKEFRQTFTDFLLLDPIDLRLRYEPETALAMLEAFAKPVPGSGPEGTGFGFVSFANLAAGLRLARLSDLVKILGGNDPRSAKWIEDAKRVEDPLAFPSQVIEPIVSYCLDNDLMLGLPVKDQ